MDPILLPLLVCLIAGIVYALSTNGKVQALSLAAFTSSTFVTLLVFATKTVKIF